MEDDIVRSLSVVGTNDDISRIRVYTIRYCSWYLTYRLTRRFAFSVFTVTPYQQSEINKGHKQASFSCSTVTAFFNCEI
jgi:hypothetical protein